MSLAKKITLVLLAQFLLFFAVASKGPSAFAQQNNPPYLVCGQAGYECSYILWDGHGSRGFVVEGYNMNFPISDQYLGFKFCMHAATASRSDA